MDERHVRIEISDFVMRTFAPFHLAFCFVSFRSSIFCDRAQQLLLVDGFCKMLVHAGFIGFLPILCKRIRRHCDDCSRLRIARGNSRIAAAAS